MPVPAELPAKVATFTGRHPQAQALLGSLRDGRTTVAGCRVLLTSRRLLADLDGAEHVQLDVFSPEESYELLERLVGAARLAAEPQAAAQVVQHCGGLPLAVHIAATRLVSRPAMPIAVLADRLGAQHRRMNELRAADRAIRATFTTSYQQLQTERHGAAATRVFDLLGLFDGADLGTDTVAALADLPAERAWQLLELLADVRLLQTHEPGRYRMHHLARPFARERAATHGRDAPQAVRRVLHHFLATAHRAVRSGGSGPAGGRDRRRRPHHRPGLIPSSLLLQCGRWD
ncbi:NB-ARC domain-containing protein [Nonomuraea angiospora]|uniref:NB-ARC domain-containing protein n=1 Tax=Nonomuraea angiospora TaxID=46172 RepID=UPI0034278D16